MILLFTELMVEARRGGKGLGQKETVSEILARFRIEYHRLSRRRWVRVMTISTCDHYCEEIFSFALFSASSQADLSSESMSPWLPFNRASRKATSSSQ